MWQYQFVAFAPVSYQRLGKALNADGCKVIRNESRLMFGSIHSQVELEPINFGTRVRIRVSVQGFLGFLWSRGRGEREGRRIVAQVQLAIERSQTDNWKEALAV